MFEALNLQIIKPEPGIFSVIDKTGNELASFLQENNSEMAERRANTEAMQFVANYIFTFDCLTNDAKEIIEWWQKTVLDDKSLAHETNKVCGNVLFWYTRLTQETSLSDRHSMRDRIVRARYWIKALQYRGNA